jgi:hypothetical protein
VGETRPELTRRREIEESLVGNPADDRKPPCVWLESVAVRCRYEQHEGVPLERRERREAFADIETEGVARVVPRLDHETKLLPGRGVDAAVLNDARDRPAPTENFCFFPAGAAEVAPGRREQEADNADSDCP